MEPAANFRFEPEADVDNPLGTGNSAPLTAVTFSIRVASPVASFGGGQVRVPLGHLGSSTANAASAHSLIIGLISHVISGLTFFVKNGVVWSRKFCIQISGRI